MRKHPSITIGGRKIGADKPCFVIAEIGINHNGSVEIAKKIIDLAHGAGFDAIKLQKKNPDISVPEHQKNILRETPWGIMSYLEYKKRIEFGEKEYKELDSYCKKLGMMWFASSWDEESIDFLEKFNVPCHKAPSALITHNEYLQRLQKTKKPIILSTGMSTLTQIDNALKILNGSPVALLHCTSTYPCDLGELNLSVMESLRKRYKNKVIGYSGHEGGILPSTIAVATYRAAIVERHVTLQRMMWGTDQAASLEKNGMETLIRDIRNVPKIKGDGKKKIFQSELAVMKKLRKFE